MTKIEQFSFLLFGFFIFEILFIRTSFFFHIPISSYTLPVSYILYSLGSFSFFLFSPRQENFFKKFIALGIFFVCTGSLAVTAHFLGNTFDTSWDGQGYHQSAVIALANNWNPAYDATIKFPERLPSQIFAEGYPSALWEIEAAVYAFFEKINSAKVLNVAIAVVAFALLYSLMRRIQINVFLSFILSISIVLQPAYTMQLLTFMEDGFSYQLLLITLSSLAIFALSHKEYWAIAVFFLSEYFLVTTKYSDLPLAFVLGLLASMILVNRFLSKEYIFGTSTKLFILGLVAVGLIFAYIPYGRNILLHRAIFYPTNIPSLMGSVTYNNVPNNLSKNDKVALLFYGIFSQAQPITSGSPTSKTNVAKLKFPFTFTVKELMGSAQLYNNRVGGGGPLFSGIVVLSIILLTLSYFIAQKKLERYATYIAVFFLLGVLGISFAAPTPNLMRYVNQLQLLPFGVVIPLYATFQSKLVKSMAILIFLIAFINVALFSYAVADRSFYDIINFNKQFQMMRSKNNIYDVRTQQFYSSYILLQEQKISFKAVTVLPCAKSQSLYASSTTTQYCLE